MTLQAAPPSSPAYCSLIPERSASECIIYIGAIESSAGLSGCALCSVKQRGRMKPKPGVPEGKEMSGVRYRSLSLITDLSLWRCPLLLSPRMLSASFGNNGSVYEQIYSSKGEFIEK